MIDAQGLPVRLGFALANEFSDRVTERGNYLWLAHSKLRNAARPELLVGELPTEVEVRGTFRRSKRRRIPNWRQLPVRTPSLKG